MKAQHGRQGTRLIARMFPYLLMYRYLRYPWSHVLYIGLTLSAERVVAFFSRSMTQNITSESGWHGNWWIETHSTHVQNYHHVILAVSVHWAGTPGKEKTLWFYLDQGVLVYTGNRFPRITTCEYWWPGHAECYDTLWHVVSLRHRLDIVIIDEASTDEASNASRGIMEF